MVALPSRPTGPSMNEQRLRVLVTDDNRDAADSVARLLSVAGHRTAVAYDGLEALRSLEADPPDAVILDIGMPGLDGWELARHIRALRGEDRPLLVAVTGYGREEDVLRSQAAGINAHVVKPADPRLLLRLLDGYARSLRDVH